ncbi:MAG: hypothetical protein Ct9H300mP22_2070 [Gammaproteobacteria bacterium]|nr:MAG: hypothetical protein Ct9H300mP22_2070 [Gammaproteobacteria bacterium]
MIRLFVFSLLAIVVALSVTLYLGFPNDPGYLQIAFGNYTFETSLFALLVASGFLYLLFKFFPCCCSGLTRANFLSLGMI